MACGYRAAYGAAPFRPASLGYDAASLAAGLAARFGDRRFAAETLTNSGGFLGVEADLGLRGGGNGFATTFSPRLGIYLCIGAFSFTLRLPLTYVRLATSAPVFPEPVAFSVTFAPLPVLSVISDWRGPFHPEPEDPSAPHHAR